MSENQTAFPALIKELSVKSLVSGDKEARLILQFIPTDEILDGLNRLHKADSLVMAAFVAIQENNRTYGKIRKHGKETISKRKSRTAEGGEV